jgi:2-polyprenyl-6-methoxyphenol hydroxylase-like FAD-dependent oxidoreductase
MALQRAGIASTLFEARSSLPADAGSYLTVASNGLAALRAIDAEQVVTAIGFPTSETVLINANGKRLGTVPIGAAAPVSRTIRRAHLHRALHDEACRRGLQIEFGKRLVDASTGANGVTAKFADGSEERGDLLIGCDGIHSPTRGVVNPASPPPRYVGLLNFGGDTPGMVVAPPGAWHMIFGSRAFFGFASDPNGGTVWFANVPRHAATAEERASVTSDAWKRLLLDLFADDRGPATELIWAGRLELAADNTHDLPSVPTWHRGAIIVIGDAAHAPSPSSGQGASMAIEDAIVLAKCLRDVRPVTRAFAAFERLRRRRVERIVAQGARSSSSKAAGPLARRLRDLVMPFVFRHLVTPKSMAWMYEHRIDWNSQVAA